MARCVRRPTADLGPNDGSAESGRGEYKNGGIRRARLSTTPNTHPGLAWRASMRAARRAASAAGSPAVPLSRATASAAQPLRRVVVRTVGFHSTSHGAPTDHRAFNAWPWLSSNAAVSRMSGSSGVTMRRLHGKAEDSSTVASGPRPAEAAATRHDTARAARTRKAAAGSSAQVSGEGTGSAGDLPAAAAALAKKEALRKARSEGGACVRL